MTTILIIEDDPQQVELFRETLGPDYDIYTYPSGKGALAFLRKNVADLVLLDYSLVGEIDGLEVLMIIKSIPELHSGPVIFISADGSASGRARALGAERALGKPFSPEFLLKEVERLLKND